MDITVRRKSAPCSVSCRKTGAAYGARPPRSARLRDPARRNATPNAAEYSVTWAMNAEPTRRWARLNSSGFWRHTPADRDPLLHRGSRRLSIHGLQRTALRSARRGGGRRIASSSVSSGSHSEFRARTPKADTRPETERRAACGHQESTSSS